MPFLWERPPRVIGHRGSPLDAPENTVASFLRAVEAGARAVELDARLTGDGQVVVMHDPSLERTTNGAGLVEATGLDAIKRLRTHAGGPVPTLAEVFAALPSHVLVNVELKADASNTARLPAAVLDVVRAADALDRVLVTSFDPETADAYAMLARMPAGGVLPFAPEPGDLAAWPRLRYLALAEDAAIPEAFEVAQKAGVRVLVWTVNDPAAAERLLRAGASSVITDRPAALLARLPEDAPAA